jgi:hypothetical protein
METAGSSGFESSKFQERERSPRTEKADRKVVLDDSQGIATPGMDAERGMREGRPRSSMGGTADGRGMKMRCRGTIDGMCADQVVKFREAWMQFEHGLARSSG